MTRQADGVTASRLLHLRWPILLLVAAVPAFWLDDGFVRLLNPDADHVLDPLADWLDRWSTRFMLAAFFAAFFAAFAWQRLSRWRVPTAAFLFGWVLNQTLVTALKHGVGRARPVHPDGLGDALRPLFRHADTLSFPSGHAAAAMLGAVLFSLWFPHRALRAVAFALAIAVAVGRSYVGAHYLSDVLAGSAIGWGCAIVGWRLALLFRDRLATARPTGVVRVGYWTVAMLVLTWLAQTPRALSRISVDGDPIPFRIEVGALETVLAPFVGLAVDLSSWPDLGDLMIDGAIWCALVAILLLARFRRRGVIALAVLAPWAALQASLAVTGLALDPRPVPRGADVVAFDLQSHVGDPHDGGMSLDDGLDRFEELGFALVLPTWHRRWSRAVVLGESRREEVDLWGMEWSAGPPADTPLHVLVYNREPKPADLGQETDWRRMIARAREAGAVVVLSHGWRGEVEEVATHQALIDAGIDGFEVAGRQQEIDPELIERQVRLEALARERGLLALASSDFHGKRTASHQAMAVRWTGEGAGANDGAAGEAPGPTALAAAVWSALKRERALTCGLLMRPYPPAAIPKLFRPLFVPLVYFVSISTAERASWMLWVLLATAVARLGGRGLSRRPGADRDGEKA